MYKAVLFFNLGNTPPVKTAQIIPEIDYSTPKTDCILDSTFWKDLVAGFYWNQLFGLVCRLSLLGLHGFGLVVFKPVIHRHYHYHFLYKPNRTPEQLLSGFLIVPPTLT
jgi:hypothetical protein